ncbi:intraflagellar transport protein 57 homolog [Ischnura elegans]|uniref:intraflagellar transport protein 57 homolog n=1 Tax=Ischnura elegans TaxID=197161 RepID=UPI001ED8BB14|nr:intraflagellar transport protein 57 homolog [Ischnura elegans]XP_046388606.1 intraflagellar transport protein 57 homolog [Ischnura elegans]XP_046388607.1 intraflagellar transport protein 57 homolog [Ischnura elegans]
MSRDSDLRRSTEDNENGPGSAFTPFVLMDEVMHKLSALGYHEDFVQGLKMKPLNRHYFALATNPMEQFFSFISLCAWLIKKMGKPFEQPQEYDDPNSIISSILDCVREKGIAITFPPSKLKQGYGENVVFILDKLTDEALKYCKISWKKPIMPPEPEIIEGVSDDEAELVLEKIEEELAAVYSDDEDPETMENDILALRGFGNELSQPEKPSVLESKVSVNEWKLEVERVLPQLKVTIKPDPRDWMYHLSDMHRYQDSMKDAFQSSKVNLEKLYADISQSMEKIGVREKYLNNELESLIAEYSVLQRQLTEAQEAYNAACTSISSHSQMLSQLTEELELVKQETEERGSSMTDGTPLVNIKKAVAQLKGEIALQEVRLGISEHCLLQSRLRDKSKTQEDILSINNTQVSSLRNFANLGSAHTGGIKKY